MKTTGPGELKFGIPKRGGSMELASWNLTAFISEIRARESASSSPLTAAVAFEKLSRKGEGPKKNRLIEERIAGY
jgi:hypothetical protein